MKNIIKIESPVEPCPICKRVPTMQMVHSESSLFRLSLGCIMIMAMGHEGMCSCRVVGDTADETVKKWNKLVKKMISKGVVRKNLARKHAFDREFLQESKQK